MLQWSVTKFKLLGITYSVELVKLSMAKSNKWSLGTLQVGIAEKITQIGKIVISNN